MLTAALDGYTTIVRNGVMVRGGKTATLPLVIKVVVAVDPQQQAPAAPVRNSRFRGLNAGTLDGTLPSYNPIESLPPSTVVLVQPTAGQTRR